LKKETSHSTDKRSNGKLSGVLLLLVQSSITIVVLVLVLLLKMINTDAFEQVESAFKNAMINPSSETLGTTQASRVSTTSTTTQASIRDIKAEAVSASVVMDETDTQFIPPLTGGVITSSYGIRTDPISGTSQKTHEGVDIAASENTALAALASGSVTEVGYEADGYGHYVIVSLNERYAYLYAHCSKIVVKNGDTVKAGDTVAYVGSTGRSTGCHVHIEWRKDGNPIDPMIVLPEETYA